jgi:hypothetical protein
MQEACGVFFISYLIWVQNTFAATTCHADTNTYSDNTLLIKIINMEKMAVILHCIKVIFFPNLLTEDPDDLCAKEISERAPSISDIYESAVARGNENINRCKLCEMS